MNKKILDHYLKSYCVGLFIKKEKIVMLVWCRRFKMWFGPYLPCHGVWESDIRFYSTTKRQTRK
jgi:hypothetical protein